MELFFKWIKQHLRIKRFLGTSENAVMTQLWCAASACVLIAIVKKELQFDASLYTLLQIFSVSVFEKSQLSSALRPSFSMPETELGYNQYTRISSVKVLNNANLIRNVYASMGSVSDGESWRNFFS